MADNMSDAREIKSTDTPQKNGVFSQAKKIAIGVAIAALAGVALYGAGWWQGRSQFASNDDQIKLELEQTQEKLAQVQNRSYLMQARGDLYNTAVNLDQRNFGTANTNLQAAAVALSKVKNVSGNLDGEKIQQLQQAIAKNNINVAVDLEKQRNTVLSYVNTLNKLIPAEETLPTPAINSPQ